MNETFIENAQNDIDRYQRGGRVALDGSKVKGNASKHKAMSYGRMKETEKRLREEVRQL